MQNVVARHVNRRYTSKSTGYLATAREVSRNEADETEVPGPFEIRIPAYCPILHILQACVDGVPVRAIGAAAGIGDRIRKSLTLCAGGPPLRKLQGWDSERPAAATATLRAVAS